MKKSCYQYDPIMNILPSSDIDRDVQWLSKFPMATNLLSVRTVRTISFHRLSLKLIIIATAFQQHLKNCRTLIKIILCIDKPHTSNHLLAVLSIHDSAYNTSGITKKIRRADATIYKLSYCSTLGQ